MIVALNYTNYLGDNFALQIAVYAINHFLLTSNHYIFLAVVPHR
jgi:hypothetical protein